MNVWMSTLRRGLTYHLINDDGRRTICGRYVGGERLDSGALVDVLRGHALPLVRAVDDYAAQRCRRCSGDAEVVAPRAVPSRDRAR